MKTEERITKTRAFLRAALKAVLLLIIVAASFWGYNYYRAHRPTSEAEIVQIESLIVAGKTEEARALMIDAQVRSKDANALRLRVGRAYLREGQIGPATALLSKVEASLIKEEHLAVAEYFLVAGDPFSASRFFDAALKAGMPRTASLLGRYGEALALSANGEGAVTIFRESLAMDESKSRVRLNLALTLANLNRLDEAKVETVAVLKTEPENVKAQALLKALGGSR